MNEPSHQPHIFLCHASEDKPRVQELYHRLKGVGYHPWLDKEDLLPGQDWRHEIEKIIRDPYNIVVVCLSRNSVTKRGVVQQEIKWALDTLGQTPEGAIYLIPARLEDCEVPDRLSELHWADLFEPDGFTKLSQAISYATSLDPASQKGTSQASDYYTKERVDLESQPQKGKSPRRDEFRTLCTYLSGTTRERRRQAGVEIAKVAAELTQGDIIEFSESLLASERAGAAIALQVMITSSPSIIEDEVITALLKLLMDRSSIVRYRAIDAVGASPRLTAAFARRLEEIGDFDSNEPVRKAANRILWQVRE